MTAEGCAFLALWNDVDPAYEAEYDAWHTYEHVPERVANPGFVAGRRYRAAKVAPARYFTLYTLASLDALRSERYADVVARPTPWSARMRVAIRSARRLACVVVRRDGRGRGGAIATLCVDAGTRGGTAAALAIDDVTEAHGVVAVTVGRADTASRFPTAIELQRVTSGSAPFVVLVEATDADSADACLAALDTRFRTGGAVSELRAAYELVFEVARDELAGADAGRPAPREDLRRRWNPG